MKSNILKTSLIFITLFVINFSSKSQTCSYTVTNNYSVTLDTDLVFKTIVYYNVQALKYDTMKLKMDIIKPIGDNNTKRPIVVYFHGMNEPYKYSQLHVKRMVDVMVKERGFLLASVDYKFWAYPYIESNPAACGNLLFFLNGIVAPYDILESPRSIYRVVQDANDAIKYVKARSISDSSCKNLCFLAGFSAGGLVASSTAFLSQPEKPAEAYAVSPANYTNLFGTALNPTLSIARGDLGICTGTINNGTNTNIKGVALFNSGIQNLNYIKTNDAPIYIYHSTNDPNIPADSSAPACFTEAKMFGQNAIKTRALNQGYVLNSDLVLANGATAHDFYNTQIRPAADFISNQINQLQCLCDSVSLTNVIESQEIEFEIYSYENKIVIKNNLVTHKNMSAKIYDVLGKEILTLNFEFNNYKELVIDNTNGIYFIELNGNDFNVSKKLVLTTN